MPFGMWWGSPIDPREVVGSKHAKGWKGSRRWRSRRRKNALQRIEKQSRARDRRYIYG